MVLESTNISNYNSVDEELLKQVCAFFSKFEQVIKELSDDQRPTIYRVIPLRRFLINACQIESDDLPGLHKVKMFLGKFGWRREKPERSNTSCRFSRRNQTKVADRTYSFYRNTSPSSFQEVWGWWSIATTGCEVSDGDDRAAIVTCIEARSWPIFFDIGFSNSQST